MAYEARYTPIGLAKQAAYLTGGPAIEITHVAVGDQGGTEQTLSVGQTDLINEVRRAAVSSVAADPDNTLRKIIQQAIPKTVGGFWVREASAIDADGDVVVIANVPPAFKPDPSSGASRLMNVKLGVITSNASEIVHSIVDGDGVFATLDFVADQIDDLPAVWPNAENLGGNPPAHYATQSALDAVADDLSTLSDTVENLQLIPTGTEFGFWGLTAPAGYVLAGGLTIGSASSGATERANADTEALFTLLWASGTNTTLPIFTSAGGASTRGASAAADFAANKRMSLPDMRGRVGVGKDDMGGTSANRLTTAGAGLDGDVMGNAGGTETHTLTSAQIPAHTHTGSTSSAGAHTHTVPMNVSTAFGGPTITSGSTGSNSDPALTTSSSGAHTHTLTIDANTGGGGAHPNVQPSIVRNVIIKL